MKLQLMSRSAAKRGGVLVLVLVLLLLHGSSGRLTRSTPLEPAVVDNFEQRPEGPVGSGRE